MNRTNIKYDHLIFLHIHKSAGMTLRSILDSNFKKNEVFTFGPGKDGDLRNFLNLESSQKEYLKLIQGHMKFGLHALLPGNSKYITFLRHPVYRIISLYYHVKYRTNNDLHKMMKKEELENIDNFVDNINNYSTRHGNNSMTYLIAGTNHFFSDKNEEIWNDKIPDCNLINNSPYKNALLNLNKHFIFVGIQEKFDESIILMKKKLELKRIYYSNKNKRKQTIKEKITKHQMEYIEQKNDLDMKLYNYIYKNLYKDIYNNKNYIDKEKTNLKMENIFHFLNYKIKRIPEKLNIKLQ